MDEFFKSDKFKQAISDFKVEDIVGVQPLSAPSGLRFTINQTYQSPIDSKVIISDANRRILEQFIEYIICNVTNLPNMKINDGGIQSILKSIYLENSDFGLIDHILYKVESLDTYIIANVKMINYIGESVEMALQLNID
jgi:hypothetical protein